MSADVPAECRRARRQVDAAVDQPLSAAEGEALDAHLDACPGCADVAEQTRALVRTLRAAERPAAAPLGLSERLAAIAGPEADAPLWLRPEGSGALPSPRRRRRRRALTGSMVLVAAAGMLFTLGLLMAPPMPEVDDARAMASLERDLTLGIGPGAQAVNAVLASAQGGRLSPTTVVQRPQLVPSMEPAPLSRDDAMAMLRSSMSASVGYEGVQRVTLAGSHDYVVADVRVAQQPGQSIAVTVLDQGGQVISAGMLPADGTAGGGLPRAVRFRATEGGLVTGHPTTLLEARRPGGTMVARWWLDPGLGLVLWNETFDERGALVRSAGFTSLRLTSDVDQPTGGLPLQLSSAPARVQSPTGPMCHGGFTCADQLAGFTLVQISSDSPENPEVVHAVYARDGVCVTVLQQRGRLVQAAHEDYGLSPDRAVLAWQSGSVVYTVTANDAADAQQVAAQLPHQAPAGEGALDRSWAGLQRLVGRGPR